MTFDSVLTGIPQILRPIWDKFSISPVYFVSPEVVNNDDCCKVLKSEIERDAEIGTHLHSEYIEPQKKYNDATGTASNEFPCYAYDTETEFAKIKNLTELIEEKLGIRPVSYRAARYGADTDTINILKNLGYKIDSSITPGINWKKQGGPDHTKGPTEPYFISKTDYYAQGDSPILEVPITISGKRFPLLPDKWMFYKWLRPSFMTAVEMKWLVNEYIKKYSEPVLNLMFHSMEILPGKTPFVRTKFGQKLYLSRLTSILKYMAEKGLQNKTLKQIYGEFQAG